MGEREVFIGDIVNFFGDMENGKLITYAAIVIAVHEGEVSGDKLSETTVDIYVFAPQGIRPEFNIRQGTELRTWNW
jgi:hypothetical protein